MVERFIVVGMDDSQRPWFAPEVMDAIRGHRVFSGGRRLYESVRVLLPEDHVWIPIAAPLSDVFEAYEGYDGDMVVFASGDPLFFGFANTLRRVLPDARLEVYPSFNCLQVLAHRAVLPYQDMRVVSLTGRPWHELDAALIGGEGMIGVLTDTVHSPAAIAKRMLRFGFSDYVMWVGERLGNEVCERVSRLSLVEAMNGVFDSPNCVILHGCAPRSSWGMGIADDLFEGLVGRPRMITKAAVRVLTLAALELRWRSCLWDIGFCTGSVSIEARLLYPRLRVVGFELRSECGPLLERNAVRFHAPGIQSFITDFVEADVDALRDEEGRVVCRPDAIFVGGHGGRLRELMVKAFASLLEGGVMVFNCVDPASVSDVRIRCDSEEVFCSTASELGMELCSPVCVAVDDYHPIRILKARKQGKRSGI